VGQADTNLGVTNPASATIDIIPPVTFKSVLTPQRLFWLFLIGLIVFTVSYGVQVFIWYRLKR
jgi:hypothetical protein